MILQPADQVQIVTARDEDLDKTLRPTQDCLKAFNDLEDEISIALIKTINQNMRDWSSPCDLDNKVDSLL